MVANAQDLNTEQKVHLFNVMMGIKDNDNSESIPVNINWENSSQQNQKTNFSSTPDQQLLIKRDGNDVLIHQSIVQLIVKYNPDQPVYVAYGEPAGCGPEGNFWMYNSDINTTEYILSKEGDYYRAKNMVNLQFQVVQLNNNKPGPTNVRFARLERKAHELGKYYFNGNNCQDDPRSAIWVKK